MDFGDEDDEDWDTNELQALETEAVHHYAATQQQRTQSLGPKEIRPVHDSQNDTALQGHVENEEHKRLEKLVQDKQGELLILKSNIARTSAEHANALDSARAAVRNVREDLSKQLEVYKDKVLRLETDLTFQRQELKDAKLRIAQATKPLQISPRAAARYTARPSNFPNKSAFDRDDADPDHSTVIRTKKRKRNGRLAVEPGADEFDLVDMKAQNQTGTRIDGHNTSNAMHNSESMDVDHPLTPIRSPQAHLDYATVIDIRDPRNPFGDAGLDILSIHKRLLEAYDPAGQNCFEGLMRSSNASDRNVGPSLMQLLYSGNESTTPKVLLESIANVLIGQLHTELIAHDTFLKCLILLQVLLRLNPDSMSSVIVELLFNGTRCAPDIFAWTVKQDNTQARESFLLFLERLAECLNRESVGCVKLMQQMTPAFYRSVSSVDQDGVQRAVFLRTLAKCYAPGSDMPNSTEMLEVMTLALEKDNLPMQQSLRLSKTICQCLYCFVIHGTPALEQARKSRHVIPRLLRRLKSELDILYDLTLPQYTMSLIKMLVQLYHILLKDEDNTTSEQHWRLPELRAIHLTTMTRILYAEEDDGFDNETQDLAMDLLEMAVSPEEGNDIYEVMGGITSE